jgi:hypothetical protein
MCNSLVWSPPIPYAMGSAYHYNARWYRADDGGVQRLPVVAEYDLAGGVPRCRSRQWSGGS